MSQCTLIACIQMDDKEHRQIFSRFNRDGKCAHGGQNVSGFWKELEMRSSSMSAFCWLIRRFRFYLFLWWSRSVQCSLSTPRTIFPSSNIQTNMFNSIETWMRKYITILLLKKMRVWGTSFPSSFLILLTSPFHVFMWELITDLTTNS